VRIVALLVALGVASAAVAKSPLSILSIPVKSRPALDALQSRISLDFVDVRPDEVLVAANPEEIDLLTHARVPFAVVFEDANDMITGERPLAGVGAYHTFAKVNEKLAAWASAMPSIASVTTIGTSAEGRAIPAIKLEAPGRVPSAERPKLLFMGLHHAREWISVEVPMALIGKLLDGYAKDASIRQLLETRTIWIVPVVNPDGLEYSQTKYTMWRKNRRKTWSWSTNGVDPNRNYGFEWVGSGSSNMPFSETYRGPEAFSESETQAVRALAEREKFTAAISFHSFSELVLFPWGYTKKLSPDDATFRKLATEMGQITKYRPQTGADLYIVNGECDDYLYGTMGVWAFTIELGKSFIPKDAEIPKITGPNVQAALHLIGKADALAADPGVMLHLIERLAGAPGAPKGPWSPGQANESQRQRTLAWAAAELGHRLSTLAATQGEAAVRPVLERLAGYRMPELTSAKRAVEAALKR
jgi:carboxypeptidase T